MSNDELNELFEPGEIIRKILGQVKLKYSLMNELLDNSNYKKLQCFIINGDSLFGELHKFLNQFTKDDYKLYENDLIYSIVSSIINMIAHYRHYFVGKNEYPNIYFCADMNDDNKCIRKALEIVKIVLKYIPNSYFVNTENILTTLVIDYFSNNKKSLILTKNIFDLMLIDKDISLITANKSKSRLYTIDNWINNILDEDSNKYEYVSSNFINIILCIIGSKGIKGVKGLGVKKVFKLINSALKDNQINDMKYSSMEDFIYDMKDLINPKYDMKKAIGNFKTYDISLNRTIITKSIQKRLDSNIEDKFSKKDLIMLNTKYFTGLNYLMLDELMEMPKSFLKKKDIW